MPIPPIALELLAALSRVISHELDGRKIRETLRLLEEALAQSDLLPVFDAMTRNDSSDS